MLHTELKDELIEQLKRIIEEKNNCKLEVNKSFYTVWLIDLEETGTFNNEFRIAPIANQRLIISRVRFTNRRCGTMTDILEALKSYGKKEGFTEILIQSVETFEMMQFCLKNEFKPFPSNILVDDVLMGDYILDLTK